MRVLLGEALSTPACEDPVAEVFACMWAYAFLPQMVIRLPGARYMPSPSVTP